MADAVTVEQPLLSHACAEELNASGDVLHHPGKLSQRGPFTGSSVIILAAIIALFSIFVEYPQELATDAHVSQYYLW